VAEFLARHGAELIITDLKPPEKLINSIEKLKAYKDRITYVLGEHRLADFENRDMIIKAAGVPIDSLYIAHARKSGVLVEMDASLFAQLTPKGVTIIGVTGTRGKSTVTHLIFNILKLARKRAYLGGNVRGVATLPLLEQVRSGDYVAMELDSWQLQGFGEAKISPKVAVFASFMEDHMNYYKGSMKAYFADKAKIFKYQKAGDIVVSGVELGKTMGKKIMVSENSLPKDWKLKLVGKHNRLNAALAWKVGLELGIEQEVVKKAIEAFAAVEGRLQSMGKVGGMEVYNDNNATTPQATVAGLTALDEGKRDIVLIMGGADKRLDMRPLVEKISKACRVVVLLAGSGTEKVKKDIHGLNGVKVREGERLEEVVRIGFEEAKKGERLLFSPAFASFGKYFENEYERNDLFVKLMKKIQNLDKCHFWIDNIHYEHY